MPFKPDLPVTALQRTQRNAFVSAELDRAAERRADAAWIAELQRSPTSRYLLVDATGRLLSNVDQRRPYWLDDAERRQTLPDADTSLLGLSGDRAYFLLRTEPADDALLTQFGGSERLSLRRVGDFFGAFEAGLCAYACGLAHWQAGMRYCNACGAPLELCDAGHRACCTNPECGRLHFPRTDPAIIVIVEHDGACLLGRQASWDPGRFSTLAGFVEPGEALEDAVRREVHEEAGVEVVDCDYHSSQPWPFPASLMLGFTATAAGRELELRDGELQEARWFTPEGIVAGAGDSSLHLSSPLSVSWHLLEHWMRLRAGVSLSSLS